MADGREIFAWPECAMFVWTGNSSGLMAYAQDVQLQVTRSVNKYLDMTTGVGYAARTYYREVDKDVALTIGTFYAGQSLYGMLASGANVSATVNFEATADGTTAQFILWSAQLTDFSLQGGDTFKQTVKLIAPDVSGL